MRRTAVLIAAASLTACAKTESAKTDTAAPAAAAAPAPAAPAALTATDVAGTVSGKVMAEKSDSVVAQFTCVTPASGSVTKCAYAGTKDTVAYTYTISADSVMWTSEAHTPPGAPKSPKPPQVIDHVVGRVSGGKWTGTGVSVLASKPDSIFSRTHWEATKTQ